MRKFSAFLVILLAATLASSAAPPDRLPSLVAPAEARILNIGGGVPVVSSCTPGTESLLPDADVGTGTMAVTGTCTGGHYDCINEALGAESTANRLHTNYDSRVEEFTIANTSTMGATCTTTTITLHIQGYRGTTSTATWSIQISPDGTNWTNSSSGAPSNWPLIDWGYADWVFNVSWIKSQVDAMHVKFTTTTNGWSDDDLVSAMQVNVAYQ